MTGAGERGLDRLERIAAEFAGTPGVSRERMFHAPALRIRGKVFAFVAPDGRLIVKLPPDRLRVLLDDGTGDRVELGGRVMREWVALPVAAGPGEADAESAGGDQEERWRAAIHDSFTYVRSLIEGAVRDR
ncbi:hypothetical protein GCM10011512_07490 [Tersicoccus solisilvae]|uniref:TfoX N-terminal domain-containing protein n=1 Tax=Tersicoccus solisilvae TaxID=1882339 RepID=A0ABQ1NR23_9MICC|nr:MmcQ/YjbR family DNA-binding protein [Tersicoccus solisilvae]GGC83237.1 hypothetical protein GCM10011512_07490 [Tersicoccus solisilvae]